MEFLIGFFTVFVLSYIVGGLACKILRIRNNLKGILKYICYSIIGYFFIFVGAFVILFVYALCSLTGMFISMINNI